MRQKLTAARHFTAAGKSASEASVSCEARAEGG